jgi:putative transposase
VFNSDQGVQFTSEVFTGVLKRKEITISMDGLGWAHDNIFVEKIWRSVKHENVYLNGYATMGEMPHQALGNKTPNDVYESASVGSAMMVDRYGAKEELPIALCSSVTAFKKTALKRKQK